MGVWQFRALLLLTWGLLVADVAAPGFLRFQVPVIGTVDVRSIRLSQ